MIDLAATLATAGGTWGSALAQAAPDAADLSLQPPPASDIASTVFYALVIVTLAVVVGGVAYVIRRRLVNPDEADASVGLGFTLADLRAMHDAGEIDDAEFKRAKAKLLAHARADLTEDDDEADDGELHLDGEANGDQGDDEALDRDEDGEDEDNRPGPTR